MLRLILRAWRLLSAPLSILVILDSANIHKSYRITAFGKLKLGLQMLRNRYLVPTGTTYKAHLAMALKILESPPEVLGSIVECGTWKGGTAANLSLICRLVGRKLIIYDSFEGLPAGDPGDREARWYRPGDYLGTLDEVKSNIKRCGAIECCEFVKGWFKDTLPHLNEPVLLAYLDVDLEASLDTCVKYIWPHLVDQGYLFTDECVGTDYVALFYSETWWRRNFDRVPPGLIGAGTGLPLGDFYIGPWSERNSHPLQAASTGAYTRKDMSGYWSYYPQDT